MSLITQRFYTTRAYWSMVVLSGLFVWMLYTENTVAAVVMGVFMSVILLPAAFLEVV